MNILKLLVLVSLLIVSITTEAEVNQDEILKIIKKNGIKVSELGIYATTGEGADRKILVNNNSEKMMIPASISKVFTTSAILKYFEPGYKFKTQLLSIAPIEKGVLKGDLYLKGGGDPSFVSEDMWYLVNVLTRNEIEKVDGDIVVDDSLFDKNRFDNSRESVRVDRAYDAPVGAMSFNWNSVNVFVRPGQKQGDPAKVFIDPENEYIQLINKAKTSGGSGNQLKVSRESDKKFIGDIIHIAGEIGIRSPEVTIYKNITQPDIWAGYQLKSFLRQRGIEISGKIRTGKTIDSAQVLALYESKSIEHIVEDMNKFSNNYIAEMLTKNLAALKKTPGTMIDGVQMIRDHLLDIGVPKDQFYIENPSGLTRDNKTTAFAMWKVLQYLKEQFPLQAGFTQSLPIAGVDGTLKKRLIGTEGERWVRAKTGFLTGVVALAGYGSKKDGHVFTFTFMYNGSEDEAQVRSCFDQILLSLIK